MDFFDQQRIAAYIHRWATHPRAYRDASASDRAAIDQIVAKLEADEAKKRRRDPEDDDPEDAPRP